MKLSMWMIANRLEFMDPEVHIHDRAPQILNSARLACATDCVTITQDGQDVICHHPGSGDFIRLKNISLSEGFELIQSVFDYYQDWSVKISQYLKANDYQNVIDCCWSVFHNPIILLNGQRKVLAMSSHYNKEKMDEEWEYLLKYGYPSVETVRAQRMGHTRLEDEKPQYYSRTGWAKFDCMSAPIISHHTVYGRINLLERDRKLNYGDQQLLGLLVDSLKCLFFDQGMKKETDNRDYFSILLENRAANQEELDYQLGYLKWKRKDCYQLFLMKSWNPDEETFYYLVADTIRGQLPGSVVLVKEKKVIVILRGDKSFFGKKKEFLLAAAKDMKLHISCSLVYNDLLNTYYMLKQAEYVMKRGSETGDSGMFDFYSYAVDYIIESSSLTERFFAIHSDILSLWLRRQKYQDTKYSTLWRYLKNDRSLIRTAAEMHIHRNTLIYHMKRIYEIVKYDQEDTYTLDYMKISMRVLNLLERIEKEGMPEQSVEATKLLRRLKNEGWYLPEKE